MKSSTWIVIPAYNEEKYIDCVLKKVAKFSKNIVVVDDGSADNTAVIAQKYCSHVLVHKVNLGKGAALKTGCEYAFQKLGAKAVILMDSDDQHDPAKLPEFFQHLKDGSRVVLGERAMNFQMPLIKIIGNRFSSILVLVLFGVYIPDIPSGYKAFTKKAYQKIKWHSSGYEAEVEIAARIAKNKLAFTTITIPTIYHDTDKGMTLLDTFEMIIKVISWRLEK